MCKVNELRLLEGLTGKGITWDASGAPTKSPLVCKIESGVYVAA